MLARTVCQRNGSFKTISKSRVFCADWSVSCYEAFHNPESKPKHYERYCKTPETVTTRFHGITSHLLKVFSFAKKKV